MYSVKSTREWNSKLDQKRHWEIGSDQNTGQHSKYWGKQCGVYADIVTINELWGPNVRIWDAAAEIIATFASCGVHSQVHTRRQSAFAPWQKNCICYNKSMQFKDNILINNQNNLYKGAIIQAKDNNDDSNNNNKTISTCF